MTKYLLAVDFQPGVVDTPMSEWKPEEIAARVSAVPGPGGVALQQPIQVRQVMDQAPSDVAEMEAFLRQAGG